MKNIRKIKADNERFRSESKAFWSEGANVNFYVANEEEPNSPIADMNTGLYS